MLVADEEGTPTCATPTDKYFIAPNVHTGFDCDIKREEKTANSSELEMYKLQSDEFNC